MTVAVERVAAVRAGEGAAPKAPPSESRGQDVKDSNDRSQARPHSPNVVDDVLGVLGQEPIEEKHAPHPTREVSLTARIPPRPATAAVSAVPYCAALDPDRRRTLAALARRSLQDAVQVGAQQR